MTVFPDILRRPDFVSVRVDEKTYVLEANSDITWSGPGVDVEAQISANGLHIALDASAPIKTITLRWRGSFPAGARFLGDAWERGYGDLEWRGMVAERPLPWYFLATNGTQSAGYGVDTGANSLCNWRVDDGGITLQLHVGCGDSGVQLGGRHLEVATVRQLESEASAFETARAFCRMLCPSPLLPSQPVYGGNDWYYAYGNNSRDSILRDSALISELSPGGDNLPFMVIDDGWQGCRAPENGGPWDISSARFGDMDDVASQMQQLGVRPGLWFRPLLTTANVPDSWRFGRRGGQRHLGGMTLDPSVPEALEFVAEDMRRFREWGFQLVKHDFSMMDIFGKWGFDMGTNPTGNNGWHFADRTRTSAEIIKDFFGTLRKAAGPDVMLIGCNTIGHLGAGLFELQRTGDDTSGYEWERTRKMGINTLAFRMSQHDTFFAVDADCVGLTTHVPWELNRQWLDVLARSGTPLFVSADPKALGAEQKQAMREAFAVAAKPQPTAEPLDWLDTTSPTRWKMGDEIKTYTWSQ
ncbi:alpha-galactosidase [bacterium]|nr:MAG: alpha-galactosidase [bacterium]